MKTLLAVLCLCMAVLQLDAEALRKSYRKSFPVEGIGELVLDGSYGQVEVVQTEGAGTVELEVEMVVEGRNRQKLAKSLELVGIMDSRQEDRLCIETYVGQNMSLKSLFSGMKLEIGYRLVLPRGISLRLVMDKGRISLGDFCGEVNADLSYTDFKAGRMSGGEFTLKQSDGRFEAEALEHLDARFSDCEIKVGEAEQVSGDFLACNCEFGSVDRMDLRSTGGKMKIGDIEKLIAGASHTEYEIGDLGHVLDMDMKWGAVNLLNIQDLFSEVRIKGFYTQLGLSFAKSASYGLEIRHNKAARLDLPAGLPLDRKPGEKKNLFVTTARIGETAGAGKVLLELSHGGVFFQ